MVPYTALEHQTGVTPVRRSAEPGDDSARSDRRDGWQSETPCDDVGRDPMTSRPHILAIDDEADILEIYVELLTDEGYRVTTDLRPTLDIADVLAVSPDLIVLDLLIQHRDLGSAFLELLRTNPATNRIPVLVCSAATERITELEDRLRAWDCRVVTKPVDIDKFLAAVTSCMDSGQSRRGDSPSAATAAD